MPSLRGQITEDQLQNMEIGEQEFDPAVLMPYQPYSLSKAEWCYVTRLRAGKSVDQAAKQAKLRPGTLVAMESGELDATELVAFWEKRAQRAKSRKTARARATASV